MDLFGEAVCLPREGRGRPAHVWTLENSNKVNLLFACGRDVKDVAAAIGVSVPTLYKHYFDECSKRKSAELKLRGLQLARLNREAEAGNVAAEKALAAMVQSERMRASADRIAQPQAKAKAAPPKGKKEQQKERAFLAGRDGDDWQGLLPEVPRPGSLQH